MKASTPLSLVILVAACKGSPTPEAVLPAHASLDSGTLVTGEADAGPGFDASANEEHAFLVRKAVGEGSSVRIVTGSSALAGAGELVCDLGPSKLLVKLANPPVLMGRLGALKGDAQVSLYVKLDATRAPQDEEARRVALRSAGVAPQTLSGSVATVLVSPSRMGDLLAIPWIVSIETPGFGAPR